MTRIGFLIPEFPGQTHAFFIRERAELSKMGIHTQLISTRVPEAGVANHPWAKAAAEETTYLFPMGKWKLLKSLLSILVSGPAGWFRCLSVVTGQSDLSFSARLKLFAFILAGAYLKIICREQNLTHVHVHSCANAGHVAMFCRLMGGPTYSMTLHGPMQDYGKNQANKWKYAAFCIVITQELFEEVHQNLANITLPPISIAPMGVDIENFKRTVEYQLPSKDALIKIVSCGRLHFVKAHDDLIRAVAALKKRGLNVQLNICGTTDVYSSREKYQETLIALTQELNVENEVNFLGSVPETRVKEELEAAQFFCLASLKEPLGVAIMEAMAMECPAIVASSPGVCEMVNSGVDGVLVNPRAPEEFVEAILKLVETPEKCEALSKAGRATVVERFHSGISAKVLADTLAAC